jgi:hypothetical protein
VDRHRLVDDAAGHALHRVRLDVLLDDVDALDDDVRSSSTRRSTVPRLPLSRPAMTTTSSPLRILFMVRSGPRDFRRQRHDLHEALGAQFARDRAEDAGADRLELGVEQHGGVAVELDQRAVGRRTPLAVRTTTAL